MSSSVTRAGGRPSRERAIQIGDAIVAATLDAFVEHGMNFNMDQVAAAAGISKQAIYRRWTGKADLLIHAVDRLMETSIAAAVADLPAEPVTALRELAWRLFDTDKRRINRLAIFLQAEALRDPRLHGSLVEWRTALLHLLETGVRAVLRLHGCDEAPAATVAVLLHDLLRGAGEAAAWGELSAPNNDEAFATRWAAFERLLDLDAGPAARTVAAAHMHPPA